MSLRSQSVLTSAERVPNGTYDSDKGVIFFSGISSSAKFFLYFSHSDPVALGMLAAAAKGLNGEQDDYT
jgi:hypothetical protein